MFTVDDFERCSKLSDYHLTRDEDKVGSRLLSADKKREWFDKCVATHSLGKDDPICLYGNAFLQHLRYISFDEFHTALIKSFTMFIKSVTASSSVRPVPVAIFLDPHKFGSEHWLIQLMWPLIKMAIDSGTLKVSIISELNPSTDPRDILVVDDALYTGMHIFGVFDNAFDDLRRNRVAVTPGQYRIHFVVPYVTNQAQRFINGGIKYLADSTAYFYSTETIPTIIESLEASGQMDVIISAYEMDERKRRELKQSIIDEFDLNPQGTDFTPLYFDFKIAKNASTATKLLESLVTPLPTRRALEAAERCHNNRV